MVKRGETKTREFQRISQQMRTLPTLQVDDPGFIRIKYLRYADDWIVGIWGSHTLAEQVKQEIKTFLSDQLQLTRSRGKDAHHPRPNRRRPLPGNKAEIGSRGRSQTDSANQYVGQEV